MSWSISELELLKENYNKPEEELLKLLEGRTFLAIRAQLHRLGISRSYLLKKFTNEEIELLKENYDKSEEELLTLFPDRSTHTIITKIFILKLPREKGWSYFSNDEIELIKTVKSMDRLCNLLPNRSRGCLIKKARELNVEIDFEKQIYEYGVLLNDSISLKTANGYLRHAKSKLKVCAYCKIIKNRDDFDIIKVNGNLSSCCKDCEATKKKEKQIYDLKYNKTNIDKRKIQSKKYRENGGVEKRRILEAKRQAIKKNLLCDITNEQWSKNLKYFECCCAYCGLSEEEHQISFNQNLHQDHLIPQSKNGVFSDFNLIPACRKCNTSKGASDLEDFYERSESFTLDRYLKIIDFILEM